MSKTGKHSVRRERSGQNWRSRAIAASTLLVSSLVSWAVITTGTAHADAAWSAVEVSAPGVSPQPRAALTSVACPAPDSCVAVGAYSSGLYTGPAGPMVASQVDGQWQTSAITAPSNADGAAGNFLSVSCSSVGNCVAVGVQPLGISEVNEPIVSVETNGSWSPITHSILLPADASTNQSDELESVDCQPSGTCTAVGYYLNNSSVTQAMAISGTMGSWTQATELPAPPVSEVDPYGRLFGVSCVDANDCTAVGAYQNGIDGLSQMMVVSESNGVWRSTFEIPLPQGGQRLAPAAYANAGGISCATAASCTVVSGYLTQSQATDMMATTESNGSWGPAADIASPPVVGGNTYNALVSVSCQAPDFCTAVGYNGSEYSLGLIATDIAGTWTATTGVQPANATQYPGATIEGVTCSSSGCVAVGGYEDNAGNGEAMALTGPALSPTGSVDEYLTDSTVASQRLFPSTLSMFPSSSLPLTSMSSGQITLNLDQQNQVIDGFGAMLTDSSAYELRQLDEVAPTDYTRLMENLFSPSGADISVLRIPVGPNDFSPQGDFSYDTPTDTDMTHFSLFDDKYESDILLVLNEAEFLNPNLIIIASPWTAPPWMKSPGGSGNSAYTVEGGTLKQSFYGAYALYLVKFLQAYADDGIHVNYLTVQNEPGNIKATTSPGMTMSAKEESTFINMNLAPDLANPANRLSTQILGYDWNWFAKGNPTSTCPDTHGNPQCWNKAQIQQLFNSPPNVAGVGWHCYTAPGNDTSGYGQPGPSAESDFPTAVNFITECTGHLSSNDNGKTDAITDNKNNFPSNLDWDSGNLITGGLNNAASGVIFFNLALNDQCGPQFLVDGVNKCVASPNGSSQCRDCRGVVTVDGDMADPIAYSVEYWLISQASAAFSPGARDVPVKGSSLVNGPKSPLQVAGAVNPDGTIGLYVNNQSAQTYANVTIAAGGEGFTIPSISSAVSLELPVVELDSSVAPASSAARRGLRFRGQSGPPLSVNAAFAPPLSPIPPGLLCN